MINSRKYRRMSKKSKMSYQERLVHLNESIKNGNELHANYVDKVQKQLNMDEHEILETIVDKYKKFGFKEEEILELDTLNKKLNNVHKKAEREAIKKQISHIESTVKKRIEDEQNSFGKSQ